MLRCLFSSFLVLACCGDSTPAPDITTATEGPTLSPTSSTSEGDGGSTTTSVDSTGVAESTGEESGSTGSTNGGFVCADVGQPCDPSTALCASGLDCVAFTPDIGDPSAGVCGRACSEDAPCEIGDCEGGMCRDSDGLPIALCPGLPSCAGDSCQGECGGGLTCKLGECIHACTSLRDCPANIGADQCKVGACFSRGSLAGAC